MRKHKNLVGEPSAELLGNSGLCQSTPHPKWTLRDSPLSPSSGMLGTQPENRLLNNSHGGGCLRANNRQAQFRPCGDFPPLQTSSSCTPSPEGSVSMTTGILPSDGLQGWPAIQVEHLHNRILGHDILSGRGGSTLTLRPRDTVRKLGLPKLAANHARSFRMPGDAFRCQCLKVVPSRKVHMYPASGESHFNPSCRYLNRNA